MNILPSSEQKQVQDLISTKKAEKCFLLYDANTVRHCDPVIRKLFPYLCDAKRIIIPAGDQYKTIAKAMVIWDSLATYGANRDALLLNIGGGMITDIGGFCAASYKRGIDFINIPTSLLGMVDASVGGKTGINYRNYKNQIGTFADAKCVYINPEFLETLPRNELHSGITEMIKHHLLFTPNALELILQRADITEWKREENILKNIELKKIIIENDYNDKGARQCLNLGHTIGHAIESLSHDNKTPLLHGEAILLGMIEELKLSENRFNTPTEIRAVLKAVKKVFFPFLNFRYKFEKLVPYLYQDKKNVTDIGFSLLENVAKPKTKVIISIDQLRDELA